MAFENAIEGFDTAVGARALAASRRIGVGFVFGGHGGKGEGSGHGAAIFGLEGYSHKND